MAKNNADLHYNRSTVSNTSNIFSYICSDLKPNNLLSKACLKSVSFQLP